MIRIQVVNAHPKDRIRRQATVHLVQCVLHGEDQKRADVNIVFIHDRRMVKLHEEYLHHRSTTDVLSFPLHEDGSTSVEGEVYVNLDQARRQARRYQVTRKNEIARLVIHGTLHLLGYDDSSPRKKTTMTQREDHYLTKMKYEKR
jgi:probable rRNA maturation factor